MKRTLLHEMGHGIGLEHCKNPECIMWENVKDWELRRFGQQSATVAFGGQPFALSQAHG